MIERIFIAAIASVPLFFSLLTQFDRYKQEQYELNHLRQQVQACEAYQQGVRESN